MNEWYPPRWITRPLCWVLTKLSRLPAGEYVVGWTPSLVTLWLVAPSEVLMVYRTHEGYHQLQVARRIPMWGPRALALIIGTLRYWRDYLWGWVRAGFSYRDNRMEREARRAAGEE